jgi:pyruvate formate lyase activating enzyme
MSQSVALAARNPYELRVTLGADVAETDVRTALATGDMGFLHSFTTGSAVDGPGVRVVAWTSGCMWRCLYCHNPDTWTVTNGIPVTIANAVAELRRYRRNLHVMGGGFTLSGGEPLMQDRFAVKMLGAAKAMGLHTALETNGYCGSRLSDAELDLIDLVMLGIKTWHPERHRRLTGMDLGPTLEFARRLAKRQRRMWVRFVLVPGLTDDLDDVAQIASFTAALGNVERVDVLPFHQMGMHKWEQLGLRYSLRDRHPPSTELVNRVCAVFRAAGLMAW